MKESTLSLSRNRYGMYKSMMADFADAQAQLEMYLISGQRYLGRLEGYDEKVIVIVNERGMRQMINWDAITVINTHVPDSTDKAHYARTKAHFNR